MLDSLSNFYPRPPRGGRRCPCRCPAPVVTISIHALREEGDTASIRAGRLLPHFYPRPPRGGRHTGRLSPLTLINFYPRPPRGGRPDLLVDCHGSRDISIHALREEGDHAVHHWLNHIHISIHALREEGDSKNREKHLRFCFSIKRSAQIWKSFFQNIRKNSCDLHRTA